MVRNRGYQGGGFALSSTHRHDAAAARARAVCPFAHARWRAGPGRLGALRACRRRTSPPPSVRLRDDAVLVADDVAAVLSRHEASQLPARTRGRSGVLRRGASADCLRQPQERLRRARRPRHCVQHVLAQGQRTQLRPEARGTATRGTRRSMFAGDPVHSDKFFAARKFRDIEHLNEQALDWTMQVSTSRRWQEDDRTTVGAQFKEEGASLKALLATPCTEATEHIEVRVGRTPFVRFDERLPAVCARPPAGDRRRRPPTRSDRRRRGDGRRHVSQARPARHGRRPGAPSRPRCEEAPCERRGRHEFWLRPDRLQAAALMLERATARADQRPRRQLPGAARPVRRQNREGVTPANARGRVGAGPVRVAWRTLINPSGVRQRGPTDQRLRRRWSVADLYYDALAEADDGEAS